ncbi:uncharacterized protein LOC108737886 [Agrilus planipennis]|uniref:aralkylamine N-acetyltransferase n=1 Tax=Agrilus planipennis TaxID=224129 RepID=A0A1W4X294_AGRPL|nr:uncharacterized protein LOC108737886 [Agrilus planipennis]
MAIFGNVLPKFMCKSLNLQQTLLPVSRFISLFRKKSKEESHYLIHRPQPDEYCEILRLLWECYYPEEPTTLSLGLGHCHNPVMDEDSLRGLSEGLSLVARCKYTGDIVAGSVNRTACPWDAEEMERFSCSLTCPKLKSYTKFNAHLLKAPMLWERFCTDKIFEISQVFVKKEERQKGLGFKLIKSSKELGADCGFRVIRLDATSHYSAKICEKLDMRLIYTINYDDYVDIYGNPVIKPPPPHCACKVYIDLPHSMEQRKKKKKKRK